jgi:hypothetical protein
MLVSHINMFVIAITAAFLFNFVFFKGDPGLPGPGGVKGEKGEKGTIGQSGKMVGVH